MPENNTVERAEQRVREMDRVTRQFSEQGNRYMRQMQNMQNVQRTQNMRNVRDVTPVPDGGETVHSIPRTGRNGTRFEPVERKREAPKSPQAEKAAEALKNAEKAVPQSGNGKSLKQTLQNQGIDGEKLLLIALMYLLITENADIKLILAIGYLIL